MLWSGVDLFFVLSGFLIAGILLDSAQSPNYFLTFYARRIHRIFPLYFIWFSLMVAGLAFNFDGRYGGNLFKSEVPLWLYPLFLQNNAPIILHQYLPVWMGMSWSLAVEEQFYLFLPWLVKTVKRPVLGGICALVILFSPIARYIACIRHPELRLAVAFATPFRLGGLAFGVIAAILVRDRNLWSWLQANGLWLCAATTVLFCQFVAMTFSLPLGPVSDALSFSAVSMMFVGIVLLVLRSNPAPRAVLNSPVLRYFGRVSFAVYIFHQGVRQGLEIILPRSGLWNTPSLLAISFMTTLILAEISWRAMESRLIRRAHTRFQY